MYCITPLRTTLLGLSLSASLPLLAGSAPGIKNFDQVDPHVYRGGQPTDEGMRYLAKIGVKTIIDLREAGSRSRSEEGLATHLGMTYVNVPMTGLTPPSEAEITRILAILEDKGTGPVFVHCQRGADRTGAVIGAYHIDHDQWANDRALEDAKAHSMSFFQLPRQNYIRNFRARAVSSPSLVAGQPAPASTETAPAASPVAGPAAVTAAQ